MSQLSYEMTPENIPHLSDFSAFINLSCLQMYWKYICTQALHLTSNENSLGSFDKYEIKRTVITLDIMYEKLQTMYDKRYD